MKNVILLVLLSLCLVYVVLGLTVPKARFFRCIDVWLFDRWLDASLGLTFAVAYTLTYAGCIAREARDKALADKKRYNDAKTAAEQKEAVKF